MKVEVPVVEYVKIYKTETHWFQKAGEVSCFLKMESYFNIGWDNIVLSTLHLLPHLIFYNNLCGRHYYFFFLEIQRGQ